MYTVYCMCVCVCVCVCVFIIVCVCVCVCVFFPFILDISSLDVPTGVTQEEDHTGFLIHLLSAVRA